MVDLGFLLFYTFLISFSFHRFLFKNLQDWTLNGKIVDSFFSHPIFLSLFLFKNLQFQLWMVRSWIPTFLMPFSCQSFFSNSSKNELWVGRCGGRGRAHHKYTLNSKHPLRKDSFHGSNGCPNSKSPGGAMGTRLLSADGPNLGPNSITKLHIFNYQLTILWGWSFGPTPIPLLGLTIWASREPKYHCQRTYNTCFGSWKPAIVSRIQ